jgi:FtsH-binding integral membrane protein
MYFAILAAVSACMLTSAASRTDNRNMREQRWVLQAIFFLAFVVSYALGFVPGAEDVGQFQDFDLDGFSAILATTLGLVLVSVFLFGAAFGVKGLWPITMALVSLRTLFNLWVAFDDPRAALGWATFGASVIMLLALWCLRPEVASKGKSIFNGHESRCCE